MNSKSWAVPALVFAGLVLGGCGTALPNPVSPASKAAVEQSAPVTVTAPAPVTVTAPVPPVVVVQPQVTVARPQPSAATPCQRLLADGYSFGYAQAAWARAGYPLSWDADRDGYPCEQSYGERN